jgi:hypothetical protein
MKEVDGKVTTVPIKVMVQTNSNVSLTVKRLTMVMANLV